MELIKIIKYLDKKFNPKLAAEWDFVGFPNLSNKHNLNLDIDINNVLICLDVTKVVVEQAIKNNIQLIISRHPFIFGELEIEKLNPAKKNMIKQLLQHNISLYSIHTNYDSSPNQAIKDLIEQQLLLKSVHKVGNDKESFHFKLKKPLKSEEFKNKMIKIFCVANIIESINWDNNQSIGEFYLTSGSGGSSMIEQRLENTFFITGEMKWNEWIYALDNNVPTLCLGHYMENYFVSDLTNKLKNAFSELSILEFDIKDQFRKGN